uniref:N-terminal methionine N(alpha)-acetyltransferase NatE n=1 Tax=Lepeophtheirus salmonis TaxID=72036 RepID=D3PJI7_LEPSM|nr:N-acetyltransferase NAT13 [Lepeophtheirus salmonis]
MVRFEEISTKNKSDFKKLCLMLFPVSYAPSFFKSLVSGEMISGDKCGCALAYVENKPIGLISWSQSQNRVHLLNLGILVHYRRKGIGSELLNLIPKKKVMSLYVQSSNQDAIEFYSKKGFKKVRLEKMYYKRLECPDAYFLEKYFE